MEQDDLREISYGTVLSGNYSFVFEAMLTDILNVHIRIEKGERILEDKIRPDGTVLYNNVTKFKTGNVFKIREYLESDWYYKVLIECVSTISLSLENAKVSMTHLFWDPELNQNKIFEKSNASFIEYTFGTSMAGIYTIDLIVFIEADVDCTNIAFALISEGRIASIIDPNDPGPDPTPPQEDPVISNSTESKAEINLLKKIESGIFELLTIFPKLSSY